MTQPAVSQAIGLLVFRGDQDGWRDNQDECAGFIRRSGVARP
jgi:hypothetical protein